MQVAKREVDINIVTMEIETLVVKHSNAHSLDQFIVA